MDPAAARVHPHQALAVYVESLASGARVAVVGDASSGVAERLAELGAIAVDVYEPDVSRARARDGRGPAAIRVQPYLGREVGARRADLVLVPDLGGFDAPEEVVAFARALAGEDGVAVIAAANRESAPARPGRSFDYYELFDLVAGAFASVRMVAQLDFRGVALVALGDAEEEPAVSVDAQLVDGDRPVTSFVALAGGREVAVDPYAIVELPAEPAGRDRAAAERSAADADALERARAIERRALEAARAFEGRREQLQAELRSAIERQRVLERELQAARARAADLEAAVREREPAIVALQEHAAQLEAAVAIGSRRLSEMAAELERERAAAGASGAAASQAAAQIEALARRAHRAEQLVERLEHEVAAAGDAHAGELLRFEEALRERGQALRQVEIELTRRERMVRELLASLEENGVAVPPPSAADAEPELRRARDENARLQRQLDGLALELARREGDIQAAAWTVAELERRLAEKASGVFEAAAGVRHDGSDGGADAERAGAGRAATNARATLGARGSGAEGDPSSVVDEIDALRRALAQEHEARVRAESGEALRQARAEIQHLTVLLEQVTADRAAMRPDPPAEGSPATPPGFAPTS